jgi:3-oxoacyl-[acyl-carrier protein] reductase
LSKLLKGQNALITGGAQGIGLAIAHEMAKHGANIVIGDINYKKAKLVEKELELFGVSVKSYKLDVTEFKYLKEFINKVESDFGPIDILVNNVGITSSTKIRDITTEEWDRIMDVNLKSIFFITQAVFVKMEKRKKGQVINIGSLSGERGGRFAGAHYSASKGALIVLTKVFALEGCKYGIRVNTICPGLIETDMAKRLNFEVDPNDIPLNRLGKPEEVGTVAVFLASDLSSYMTGQCISVNGGQTMR